VPSRDAIRLLPRQQYENSSSKTHSNCTRHFGGCGASRTTRSGETSKATQKHRSHFRSKNRCDNRQIYTRRTGRLSEGRTRRKHHSFRRTIQRERIKNCTTEGSEECAERDCGLAGSYSTTPSNGASACYNPRLGDYQTQTA
jgi:hypothetical protein